MSKHPKPPMPEPEPKDPVVMPLPEDEKDVMDALDDEQIEALLDDMQEEEVLETFNDPSKVSAETAVATAMGALHERPDQAEIQQQLLAQLDAGKKIEEAVPAPSNPETVYAIPYYRTPDGMVKVGFDRVGGMIGLPDLSSLIMEDHMRLQPLTNDTNTALSVDLGVHTNAPPLQAAGDAAQTERIWIDVSAITRVAGSLPSLDANKPTPGYTASKDGESYILSPDQNAVMDAAINRLDALQASEGQRVDVNIKINQGTPTNVAQSLNAQHHSTLNATDLVASL